MRKEGNQWSRREFLQQAGAAAAYEILLSAGIPALAESFSKLHTAAVSIERTQLTQPKLLDNILPGTIAYGSYPDRNSLKTAVQASEKIGHRPQILGFFCGGNEPLTTNPYLVDQINQAAQHGFLPLISWGTNVKKVNLHQLIKELSLIKSDFLWRPWYEMQGHWTRGPGKWYGEFSDREFIAAWTRMWHEFKEHVPLAQFLFSPNSTDIAGSFEGLFPENFVDFVGLDSYNKWSPNFFSPRHYAFSNLPPELAFGPDIATFQRIASKVPFILAEIGSIDQPQHLSAATEFAILAGAKAWIVFEWNKAHVSWQEADWSLARNPHHSQALAQELGRDYYMENQGLGLEIVRNTLAKLKKIA